MTLSPTDPTAPERGDVPPPRRLLRLLLLGAIGTAAAIGAAYYEPIGSITTAIAMIAAFDQILSSR
ncbi:hypothetical protein ACFWAD_29005 [Rhodococcus sp. NPDC059969]|uniref:hypothetical protein n=1 Tax=Rhodococcus TaxID=1827 RepID=UPI0015F47C90|nr:MULTISPECIES: hypothetical protein [Rhodococcus]MBY6389084.1 hypothetical protein [Rhodococcus erythropolis]